MGFLFVLAVIVGGTLVVAANKARAGLNQAWSAAAAELGLAQTAAGWNVSPRLHGTVSGHRTTIDIDKRGSGKTRVPWTRFSVGIPDVSPGLVLREENFFSSIARALGTADIEVGSAKFDEQFNISGRDADAVRAYLTPERRSVLQEFFTTHRGAVLEDSMLTWASRGKMKNSAQMVATVGDMLAVSRRLAGDEEAVAPAASETAPEAEQGHDSAAVPEIASASLPAGTVELSEFCDQVFAPGAMSFKATQAFDRTYKGQQATWSGTLRAVEPYNFDFVFGSGKGVRAIFDIHKVEGNLTGDGVVKAIVQLPIDASGLDRKIGEQLAFSGALIKVDGLMRKVFLADGNART